MKTTPINDDVNVYFADWCPFCAELLEDLEAYSVPHTVINVDDGPYARGDSEWVKSVNNGNRVVPTVRFSDGTSLTNPSVFEVMEKLRFLSSSS